MYFWANSRRRIENSVEKAAVFLHPLYIIGIKDCTACILAVENISFSCFGSSSRVQPIAQRQTMHKINFQGLLLRPLCHEFMK